MTLHAPQRMSFVGNFVGKRERQFEAWREVLEKNGRHEETRTPDLYRVKVAAYHPAIDSKEVNSRLNR